MSPAVRRLLDSYVSERILLDKATVTLYEDIQEFWVAERDDDARVVGCGALHVMWEDLAEVRTLAVNPGSRARASDISCWTSCCRPPAGSEFGGFSASPSKWTSSRSTASWRSGRHPVDADVYGELLRSYDEGVAEFLGLERVKPNTLGNSRMLLHL